MKTLVIYLGMLFIWVLFLQGLENMWRISRTSWGIPFMWFSATLVTLFASAYYYSCGANDAEQHLQATQFVVGVGTLSSILLGGFLAHYIVPRRWES